MNKWMIPVFGLMLALAMAALSCGEETFPEPRSTAEPTPTIRGTAPGDVPTLAPVEELTRECEVTLELFVGPIDVLRGSDRVPSGFDPGNSAGCTFNKPVSSISLELLRDGKKVFGQTITLDPPSEVVGFPLSEDLVELVPAGMEPGLYDRRIQVTSTDGRSLLLISDTIWVFDPAGHPVTKGRRALAESLDLDPDVTSLLTYEPVVWSDTSLGCPEPGEGYSEVETHGFQLVFTIKTPELWEQKYEYHTNLDGSIIILCKTPDEEGTVVESPIEFAMDDSYALGQAIEIKIRNIGTKSYVYSEYYPACRNLEFYNDSQQGRSFERFEPPERWYLVELPPGLFIIPEGTHCDIANESEIKPGEEVVLLNWGQHECLKDKWGCVESVPVKAGHYTIVGKYPESKGSSDPNALSFEKGNETVAEWSFTIVPSKGAQTGSPDGSDASDYDYKSLRDDLARAGATVEELGGPPESPIGFSVGGPRVAVNGGLIQVYEFPDGRAANTEAEYVSPDGYNITVPLGGDRSMSTHSDWLAPPHYYKKGRVILRYVGDSMVVLEVLEAVLGPQFAGQTTPAPTPAANLQPAVPVSHVMVPLTIDRPVASGSPMNRGVPS